MSEFHSSIDLIEKVRKEILKSAFALKEYKLISLSGGNISVRLDNDEFAITPSGVVYDELDESDIPIINSHGQVILGDMKPSSDTPALLHIFENIKDVNAIIHTHQPYATAAGFLTDEIPEFLVTLIDAVGSPVPVAPFTPSSDIGMGITVVQNYIGGKAIILKHHGVVTLGSTLEEALFAAVYLEEAMKTYCIAKSISANIPPLKPEEIEKEKNGWKYYGQ